MPPAGGCARMRRVLAILALAPLLVLASAPPAAAATAVAGTGLGQAAFTICFNFNVLHISLAGATTGADQWSFAGTVEMLHPQCSSPPLQEFSGTWDASAGGCGLRNAAYELCLGAVPLGGGVVPWRICPGNAAVCDGPNTLYFGTINLAGA